MKIYKINYIVYKDLFDHKEIIEDVKEIVFRGENLTNVNNKLKEEISEKYSDEVNADIYLFLNYYKFMYLKCN